MRYCVILVTIYAKKVYYLLVIPDVDVAFFSDSFAANILDSAIK